MRKLGTGLVLLLGLIFIGCGDSKSSNLSSENRGETSNLQDQNSETESGDIDSSNSSNNENPSGGTNSSGGSGGNGSSSGSGGSVNGSRVTTKNAVLYDSIVTGARYDAGSGITGLTDANGVFRYVEGHSVKFYIGDVFLGEGEPIDKPAGVSIVTDKILTPLGLAGAGDDINNIEALRIVRFLMALDSDGNANNGMSLDRGRVLGHNLSLLGADDATFNNLTLPSFARAREHLCQSLHRTTCSQAPIITGTPKTTTNIYSPYQFLPMASDINSNTLTFSIQNRPSWATFNTTTGLLQGTPMAEGNYSNITISVTDGSETVSLDSFDIVVGSALDIAHRYGNATQGTNSSYSYYSPANYAIDNNDSTFNHTRGGANGKNWLQIELPNPTKVSKIVIQNRGNNSHRLTNAKVYISDTPYTGSVDTDNLVKTLEATDNEQIIDFDSPKSGRYLLIKGETNSNDERHIHLKKVEVYGETPPAPMFASHEASYLIQGTSTIGYRVAQIEAIDYQGDVISYSIDNSAFRMDSSGHIIVNSALQAGVYSVIVTATDGVHSTTTNLTINVTSSSAVDDALHSGVVDLVTEEELLVSARAELETLRTGETLLSALYQNNSIAYTPSHNSQLINITGDVHKVYPILYGTDSHILAVAGTKSNGRFSAFGSVPMEYFQDGKNLDYETPMKRLLLWLIGGEPLNSAISTQNRTIALSFANYATDTKNWLTTNYPDWTIKECNDIATHANCLNGVDLVIQGSSASNGDENSIKTDIETLLNGGTPVLYLHPDWGVNPTAQAMAKLFEFSLPYGGNWWSSDKANWSSVEVMQLAQFNLNYGAIDKMLAHFQSEDYNFDWSRCKDSDGNRDANYDNCVDVIGLDSEFQSGATKVKSFMNGLDSNKKNIFATNEYRLQKLLALIGDKFRKEVVYPMDKVTTDDNEFMKSYYSDHAIYNYRTINPTQPNMGNFSRSDFSHITPTTRRVQIDSKKSFRSTGAYALPGQTVRVTRNDNSDLTVKVFINSLRSGATHQYQRNGYNRPKYLQTPHFEIKSGETIEITSPYGGTLQLEFSKNDLPIDVTFSNVGEHAYWATTADNNSFAQKLTANEYEWAEIATAGFTVHSKLDKMVESVSDIRWGGTAEGLANAVVKYTSNYPHVVAGFKGEGVDVVDEIHDWATSKGLTIETIDIMKHMNADQATCGYGCSGNPYDAYWAFDPIGHGDIHEMGHSMQKMRFEGFPNHAATNTFSYYTKARYFANTGGEPDCQGLPFKTLFETIQNSVGQSDIQAYLKTNLWDVAGLGEQYLLKIQAMMHSQKLGKVQNGWHVLARVHILEREMGRAKQDWEGRKASVGFSTYSLDEINTIRNNDWLTVAYSYASELDLRNYFTMMGIPFSQKAKDQIASFNFDVAPNSLFVSTNDGYCKTDDYGTIFDRPTLSVDGTTAYSY